MESETKIMEPYNEDLRKADINIAISGDNTIIAAPTTAGNFLAIDFMSMLPTTAVAVQLKDGATAYGGPLPLDTKQAITWENAFCNQKGVITMSPNQAFVINLGSAVQVGGLVRYREVGN